LGEPKIFIMPQTPSWGVGRPKFNQLEMVTTFTYKSSLVRIDACNFELIMVTDPPTHTSTHPQADRTDYNTLDCS